MSNISVTLSSSNMGLEATESDFQAWQSWVCDKIDDAMGFVIDDVDMHRFGDGAEDTVIGGTEEQCGAIKRWLSVDGWNDFCGEAWGDMLARPGGQTRSAG